MTNVLVNLPAEFHSIERFKPAYDRLATIGPVRTTSHNTPQKK